MKRLSATEYGDYLKCHRLWYMKYVMKIPLVDSINMEFGRIWHEFMELYHMGASLSDFWKEFELYVTLPEKEKSMLKNMMINYQKYDTIMNEHDLERQRRIPRPDETEFFFEKKFENSKLFFDKNITLVGKMDMAFLKDGVLTVVDHKTSSGQWSAPMLMLNPQAEFYHVLLSHAFKDDLEFGNVESVEFLWNIAIKKPGTRSEIMGLFQRERIIYNSVRDNLKPIVQVIEQMETYTDLPFRSSGPMCNQCSYLSLCMSGNNMANVITMLSSEVDV